MSVLTLHLWGHETMTHGQSVSSCFYRGRKQTNHKSDLTLLIKRGLTCKEKHPRIIKNLTRYFFSVILKCTELQLLKHQFILMVQVLIFWSKTKDFLVFSNTKQIYLLTILLALLQTMKHQSKLSFNPQQLLTKLGVFKRKQNQCRCPL